MRFSRRKTVVALVAIAAAGVALVSQIGASSSGQQALKLEGAWVARVISYKGVPGQYAAQWSYVLSPDASGRSAGIHGSIEVGFPDHPLLAHDFNSPLIGEVVQTGPDTASFNSYWYAISKGENGSRIVYIARSWGELGSIEPGRCEVSHNFEIYLPSADIDGDGIPEGTPINEFTVTTMDTRIPPPQ